MSRSSRTRRNPPLPDKPVSALFSPTAGLWYHVIPYEGTIGFTVVATRSSVRPALVDEVGFVEVIPCTAETPECGVDLDRLESKLGRQIGRSVSWGRIRSMRAARSWLADEERGKGLGVELYLVAAKAASDRGYALVRDACSYGGRTSGMAQRVWGSRRFSSRVTKEGQAVYWNGGDVFPRPNPYWGTAGAGILFLAQDTGRLLFPLRSQEVYEPGTWGVWGGQIEEGEDPAEAAAREANEEMGADISPDDLIPLMVFHDPGKFVFYNFLAVVPHEFEPELQWETDDYRWVEFGDWPQPLHPKVKLLLKNKKSLATIRSRLAGGPSDR